MKLPKMVPGWQKLAHQSDAQLFDLHRDYKLFFATADRAMAQIRGRFKALTSEIMKREAGSRPSRSTGSELVTTVPSTEVEIVTDHAMVRYLERKRGLDVAALRDEIRANIAAGEPYLNGALTIHDDMIYVRRSGGQAVSTVMPVGFMDDDDVKLAGELFERDLQQGGEHD